MSSSARAGSSPLVGSSSTSTGPGANRARATASRRRSPPDRVTPSSPTGVSSPWGSAATQASRRAARSAPAISSSSAPGRPSSEVGPHRAGEELCPLVGQRTGGARIGLAQPLARRCRRARACRPRAASSAGARRRGSTCPHRSIPSRRNGRRPAAAGSPRRGRGEGRGRSAARPRQRRRRARPPSGRVGSAGSSTGTGTSSSAKRRSAAARTSSERATARGTPGTVSKVASAASGRTATMTWPR